MTTEKNSYEPTHGEEGMEIKGSIEIIRYIIRHDPNAIAVYDCNLHYLAVSGRYLQDYNVREEDIIGKHHYEVFPEIPQRWKDVHQRCLAGAIERNDDDCFERADGSLTYNRWECRPWYRMDGEIGGIVTYTEVTTDRKIAEKALMESETKYRTFFENSMDAILLTSPDGTTLSANKAACTMFGYSEEELIQLGRKGVEDTSDPSLSNLLTERKLNGNAHGEVTFIRKDGTRFPAEISTTLFRNKEGQDRSCMIIRDITARKETDNQIKFQANLLQNVGKAVIAKDIDNKVTYWNSAAEKIYGWTSEEALGKNIDQLTSTASTKEQAAEIIEALKGGNTWYGELLVKRKDGGIFPAVITDAPIFDTNGNLAGVIEVTTDITERKKAEETLLKLSSAIEQTIDTVAITNRDGIIEYVNPAFEAVTGYSAEEAIGNTPRILKSGFKGPEYYREMWKIILSGKVFREEVINKKKNGEFFYEQKTISPIFDKKGNITHFIGTGVDISERKRTEEALIENEKLYRNLFENMLNGFAYCKMIYEDDKPFDFTYLAVNKSFEKLTGLKGVTGRNVSEVIPGIRETDPELFDLYGTVALTGKPETKEIYVEAIKMWFSISVYSPQKEYFVAIFDEITSRKNAERELILAKEKAEESDRLKSAFLANMSHEVRTPLNSILSFSSFLSDPSLDEEQKIEFIGHITANGNNLMTIINDIMDISRIEAGEMIINKQPVRARPIMELMKEQCHAQAQSKNLDLRLQLPGSMDETTVIADAERLRQVLDNLMGNALKFTKSGTIEIGYYPYDSIVVFYVKDTGIGIPEKYQDKIFDRFRQVEDTKTRNYGGNGLGLAICKKLVEMMNGKIWVESEPGKGSAFYFTLPCLALGNLSA